MPYVRRPYVRCAGRSLVATLDSELDMKPENWLCLVQWTARSFGSYLVAHLVATIEQLFFGNAAGPTLVPGVLSRPEDKLVYVALGSSSSGRFRVLRCGVPPFPGCCGGVPSVSGAEAALLLFRNSECVAATAVLRGLADLWFDYDGIACPDRHRRAFEP